MKLILTLLALSLTSVIYCEQIEEPSQEHVDFDQKYEAVFGEKPSSEIWARRRGKTPEPERCGCCTNIYMTTKKTG